MEQSNEEIWKDIPEYQGKYQVSNCGRIKSLTRKVPCVNGVRTVKERILKQAVSKRVGYPFITLASNCIHKSHLMHRLISEAFIPNPENKPQVNHKNGIKTDNRICNLEWVTYHENRQHAFDTGLQKPVQGECHGHSIVTEKIVKEIRESKERPYILCKHYNISETTIRDIRKRRSWRHL